jgi:patatin-like phospholipase/acyl hydrolase
MVIISLKVRWAFCRNWILSKIFGTLRMVRGPKYDGKYLHALLRQYLGDMRLDKALTSVIIPTFDIAFLQPTIFSSFEVNLMCPPVYW